jgi:hypothetical protein
MRDVSASAERRRIVLGAQRQDSPALRSQTPGPFRALTLLHPAGFPIRSPTPATRLTQTLLPSWSKASGNSSHGLLLTLLRWPLLRRPKEASGGLFRWARCPENVGLRRSLRASGWKSMAMRGVPGACHPGPCPGMVRRVRSHNVRFVSATVSA